MWAQRGYYAAEWARSWRIWAQRGYFAAGRARKGHFGAQSGFSISYLQTWSASSCVFVVQLTYSY